MRVVLTVNLGDMPTAHICVEDHMSVVDQKMNHAQYHKVPITSPIYERIITKDVLERLGNPEGVWVYTRNAK